MNRISGFRSTIVTQRIQAHARRHVAGWVVLLPWTVLGINAAEPPNWIGQSIVAKPGAVLMVPNTNRPLDMKECDKLPWTITAVNGDWLWMGKAWIQKKHVRPVGDLEQDQELVATSETIRTQPADANHFISRSWNWGHDGRDDAIADLTEACRLDPKHECAVHYRANHYEWAGKTDLALADFNAAVALQPEMVLDRGEFFLRLGKWQQALADFDQYLKLHPDPKEFGGQQGLAAHALFFACCPDAQFRKPDQALADATASGALDALAAAQAAKGDFDAAVKAQQEYLEKVATKRSPDEAAEAEQRLELYREKKPYVLIVTK